MLQFCVTIYKGSQAKIAALPLIVQKTGGQKLGITLFLQAVGRQLKLEK